VDLTAPVVMGVLNITPDSFSDGGAFMDQDAAIARAQAMADAGAAIIDIGGESTRPGAEGVDVDTELARVVPVVETLAPRLAVPLSVDTSKPEVMREAARAGAGLINDVTGFRGTGSIEAAADSGLPLCIMHMQGTPATMQNDPRYGDVVRDVYDFLAERVAACEAAGISRDRLIIDPGFGFGKTPAHNARLLRELESFQSLRLPILVGLSRKGMIGHATGRDKDQRVAGSVAAATLAVRHGARIVRAHDVAATLDALALTSYVMTDTRGEA
jgi:dihydropteroate synthase